MTRQSEAECGGSADLILSMLELVSQTKAKQCGKRKAKNWAWVERKDQCDQIPAEAGFRNRPIADLSHGLDWSANVMVHGGVPFSDVSPLLRQ